jgi:hypothetical protein
MSKQSDKLEQQIKAFKKLRQSAATSDDKNNQRENKKDAARADTKDPNQEIAIIKQNPLFELVLIFLGEVGAFIAWILADFFSSAIWLSGYLFFFAIFFLTGFGVNKTIKSEPFQVKYKKYGRYVWVGFGVISIVGFAVFSAALEEANKNIKAASIEKTSDRRTISNMATQIANDQQTITNMATQIATLTANLPWGVLEPANDPMPPPIAAWGPPPTNVVTLLIGNSVSVVYWFPHTVIRCKGKPILTISKNEQGATVSGEFFGDNGNVVCVLENNRFIINPSNYLIADRPDKSTLIVRDQKNIEVLNVRFLNPYAIRLDARFRFPNEPDLVISPYEGFFRGTNIMKADMIDYDFR